VLQGKSDNFPVLAHRDLASRIHVRNAAESGQTRTDAMAHLGPKRLDARNPIWVYLRSSRN
jgi:hypothetical protein